MEKIKINRIKKIVKLLDIDDVTADLLLLNAEMHNELVDKYLSGEKVNFYILLQLRIQIQKTILEIKKLNKKNADNEDVDDFLNSLKNKKEIR